MLAVLILGLVLTARSPDLPDSQDLQKDSISIAEDSPPEEGNVAQRVTADSLPVFSAKGIVVTATRTPLTQLSAPASVSIIEPHPSDPSQDAVAAFSQVPGGTVGITGGLGSVASFSIRGSSSEQVLFLLDGMPLNSGLTGGYDLNKLGANIERIEIVKGPASALYGANALAGVVNIITEKAIPERPFSRISYLYGKHKQQNMSAFFSRRLSGFLDLCLSADWKSTDGDRSNSDYSGSNYFLGIKFKPASLIKFGLEYKSYQSLGGSPGRLDWLTPDDRMSDDQQDYSASLEYSDMVRFKVSQSQLNTFYYYGFNNTTTGNYSRQSNADLQVSFDYLSTFRSLIGTAYQQVKSESDNSGNHKVIQQSAFCNQEYRPFGPWLIVAGVRYDKSSSFKYQISPSISSSWQLNDALALFGSYGQAYRAPTINERFWSDPYSFGSPGLSPEKSWQSEVGGRIQTKVFSSSLALYQRKTRDMIKWFSDPVSYLWTNANLGRVKATGLEFDAGLLMHKYYNVDLNYSYCLAKVASDNDRELNYTPANSASLSFAVRDLPLQENLRLNWEFATRYHDRQVVNHPDLWGPGIELPRYLISSQTLSLKIRDAVLFYKVENLFNAEYQVRYLYPMPLRSYAFGISMELWD